MHMSYMLINSSACGYDVIMITMIKKTRLRQVKIESKIDFRGIVWKIVSLSTFTVKN